MIAFPALPSYTSRACHIYWEPIVGSGERITAAVALRDQNGEPRVVTLLSPEILSLLYRGQGPNASSLLGMVADSARSHLRKTDSLDDWIPPVSGFIAQRMRDYAGESVEDILDQVAGMHASLYKARAPEKPETLPIQKDEAVRVQIREAARKLYGLRADQVFTQTGMIEVQDRGQTRHLHIPIKTKEKVGSIISAWYSSPATIERHFLRAQSDLSVASERGKYQPGLFISMPSGLDRYKNHTQIENLIDDIYWRLRQTDCYLEVGETPEGLAKEIVDWAA